MASPNEQSQLLRTALEVIESYNKWDIDAIMAPRAPNCTHTIHPTRLNFKPQTNDEYRKSFAKAYIPTLQNYHVEILDIVEDEKRHKVSLHVMTTADSVVGKYENENVWLLEMTEDDKQLVSFKEFLDSGYSDKFFEKLEAHMKEKEA